MFAAVGVVCAETPVDLPTPNLVGARATGMGGAFVAIAEDAPGVLHNPAGLGIGRGVALFGQTNLSRRETLKFDPKGIAFRLDGVGFAWSNKLAIADMGVADYTYSSAGLRLGSRVALGVSVKTWRTHPSRSFQVFGNSASYDVGLIAAPSDGWGVGSRIGSLRRGARVESAAAGVARRFRRGVLSTDYDWNRRGGSRLRVGVEALATTRSAVRVGWDGRGLTAGVGLLRSDARLDAAWTRIGSRSFVIVAAEAVVGGL